MELNYKYDGTDDHMDSRLIEEDIVSIEEAFGFDYELFQGPGDFGKHIAENDSAELAEIYEAIESLRSDSERANEGWEYGIQFVRKDAADGDWARERAIDLGYIERQAAEAQWPWNAMDWDAAAEAYIEDSPEFEFRGVTYFED